jgi:hypothetical protein
VGSPFGSSFAAHGSPISRPRVRQRRTVFTCLHRASNSCSAAARRDGAPPRRSRASWSGCRADVAGSSRTARSGSDRRLNRPGVRRRRAAGPSGCSSNRQRRWSYSGCSVNHDGSQIGRRACCSRCCAPPLPTTPYPVSADLPPHLSPDATLCSRGACKFSGVSGRADTPRARREPFARSSGPRSAEHPRWPAHPT